MATNHITNHIEVYKGDIAKAGFAKIIIHKQIMHLDSVDLWRDFDSNGLTIVYIGAGPMATELVFRHRFFGIDPVADFLTQLGLLGAKPFSD